MHKPGTNIDVFSTDASTAIFTRSTFLSNGMASDIHFFTRSTITTKKRIQVLFFSRFRDANKTAEVSHAIQR